MAEVAVVNASPLIFLASAELLDLLRLEVRRIVVPTAVISEIERRGSSDTTVAAIRRCDWLIPALTPPPPAPLQAWDLGPGETAVLTYALLNPGSLAILDDLAARRCAVGLRIPVRGTLGLVLRAKMLGRISLARPVAEMLRAKGMYLSDRVLERALREVGE